MNKVTALVISGLFISLSVTSVVFALDATNSATPEEKNVKLIREKLLSTVEDLRKKNQQAYAGVVTKIQDTTLTVVAPGLESQTYTVKLDETLTSLYRIVGTSKKEIKKSDIKNGDYVIITGQILGNTLEANELYIDEQFLVRTGTITDISKSDYYLKVTTSDKEEFTLDIQNSTRQFMYNIKTHEIDVAGFSKLKEGDSIHFVVSKTNPGESKEKNRFDAVRILVIPQEFFAQ